MWEEEIRRRCGRRYLAGGEGRDRYGCRGKPTGPARSRSYWRFPQCAVA